MLTTHADVLNPDLLAIHHGLIAAIGVVLHGYNDSNNVRRMPSRRRSRFYLLPTHRWCASKDG